MITIFNFETAHEHGDVLPQMLKFRHDEFVLRQGYEVPTFNGMEYDQYDTPAAVYVIWQDGESKVRAGMRILPTNRPYMIKEIWPQTVREGDLPESPLVWEATRFFVDRKMEPDMRQRAHGKILCAMLEFALRYGISDFIATAPPRLWHYTFRRCGWPAAPAGEITEIGFTEKIQTCVMPVSEDVLTDVRRIMGIDGAVIPGASMQRENIFVDMRALQSWVCCRRREETGSVGAKGKALLGFGDNGA